MAPPSIVNLRVREIHAALLEAGWANKKFPRDEMEKYLAQELGMSLPNIRAHIDMGRALGLWQILDRRPRPGALLVLPAQAAEVRDNVAVVDAART